MVRGPVIECEAIATMFQDREFELGQRMTTAQEMNPVEGERSRIVSALQSAN